MIGWERRPFVGKCGLAIGTLEGNGAGSEVDLEADGRFAFEGESLQVELSQSGESEGLAIEEHAGGLGGSAREPGEIGMEFRRAPGDRLIVL